MNKNFFVSVIIPTYNCERFVSSAVRSVLNQSYANFELIIVDDGSTDNTAGIIQRYTDQRIRYVRKKNGGMASARNAGIKESRGDYVAWLDADDVFAPDILKTYINIIRDDPQVFFLYPNLVHIDEDSRPTGVTWTYKDYSIEEMIALLFQRGRSCIPGIASTMAKRDSYERIGFLDHKRKSASDYDFLTKFVGLKHVKLKHVNKPLYLYRQVATSVSHNLEKRNFNVVAVMKNMLKMYSFGELFPDINLSGLTADRLAAEQNFRIGKVFLDQGLLFLSSPHCSFYLKEAESYLTKAIKLNPDHDNCIANLGTLYLSTGKYSESIRYLSQSGNKFPDSSQINNNLGYAYYNLKELDKAKTYLEKALLVSPDFERAKHNLDDVERAISVKGHHPNTVSKDTLKLLFLADSNSTHTKRWANFFHDCGHEIHIFDSFEPVDYPEGIIFHKPAKMDLPTGEKPNDTNMTIHIVFEILKVLDRVKPDLVHCHYITTYGLWGALCGFTPLVMTAWGSDIFLDSVNNPLLKKFIKFSLRKSQLCTADSHDLLNAASDMRGSRDDFHYIPFGIDTDAFSTINGRNPLRDKLNIQTSKVVLSPRQFKPQANIHVLIKAVPEILKKVPDTTFVLKTYLHDNLSDEYFEILKKLVRVLGIDKNVIFLNEVDYDEMVLLYNMADVTVSLRDTDGSSCSVLEAASCGSPLVTGNIESMREWLVNGKNAFLVNQRNEKEVADAIVELLINEKKARQFATQARKLVVERADYRRHWIRMEELYFKYRNNEDGNEPVLPFQSLQETQKAEDVINILIRLAVNSYHNREYESARACYSKIFEIFNSYDLAESIDTRSIKELVSSELAESKGTGNIKELISYV